MTSMIVSTLPDLPGRRFEVRGLVFAQATLGAIRGGNVEGLVASLVDQAGRFGATPPSTSRRLWAGIQATA